MKSWLKIFSRRNNRPEISCNRLKIHAYFVCYNEEKILPFILDYYLSFCSKIFLFDNLSNDRTLEIARGYPEVKVIPFDTFGKKDNSKHV